MQNSLSLIKSNYKFDDRFEERIYLNFLSDFRIDFAEKPIWWTQPYLKDENQKLTEIDEYEVMRENSPWPKRNHNCFLFLNVFMERLSNTFIFELRNIYKLNELSYSLIDVTILLS